MEGSKYQNSETQKNNNVPTISLGTEHHLISVFKGSTGPHYCSDDKKHIYRKPKVKLLVQKLQAILAQTENAKRRNQK